MKNLFPQVGVKSFWKCKRLIVPDKLACFVLLYSNFTLTPLLYCFATQMCGFYEILTQLFWSKWHSSNSTFFLRLHFSAFSCILPTVLILTIFCSWMAKQLSTFHSAASQCNGVAACSATALIPFWSAPEKRWSTVWTSPAFYRLTNWKPVKEWFLKIIISIALERCSWCHSSIG